MLVIIFQFFACSLIMVICTTKMLVLVIPSMQLHFPLRRGSAAKKSGAFILKALTGTDAARLVELADGPCALALSTVGRTEAGALDSSVVPGHARTCCG